MMRFLIWMMIRWHRVLSDGIESVGMAPLVACRWHAPPSSGTARWPMTSRQPSPLRRHNCSPPFHYSVAHTWRCQTSASASSGVDNAHANRLPGCCLNPNRYPSRQMIPWICRNCHPVSHLAKYSCLDFRSAGEFFSDAVELARYLVWRWPVVAGHYAE